MLAHPDTLYIDDGVDFLDPQLYSPCRASFGVAAGLPRRAYTSEVFQRLENEKVWTRDWVCIGTLPEIAGPLDLLPFTIGQHAVHVQRLPDGGLIGRFNKAQHGGCRAIPAQCRTGKKTKCSYTSCGYSRDRDVIPGDALTEMSPQMGQYLGAVPERLLPVKVRTCGPLIFANVDPTLGVEQPLQCPEWSENLVRLEGHWRDHRANWKLAGAAIVDAARSCVSGGGATNYVSAEWIFPNLVMVRSRGAILVVVLQPTAMDQTLWRLSFFAQPALTRAAHEAACGKLWRLLDEAAGLASSLQSDIELSLASDITERTYAGWQFNQKLIERIGQRHVAYWNAPLMRA
jgi:hypothetical protein